MRIEYSNGDVVEHAVIDVWDDLHAERPGYFRAFWVSDPVNAKTGSPVIGYCSPGGSHRTISAVVGEVARYYPNAEVYRNGKRVR